ncbi:hypothetical protein Q9L42_020740 (plasmid) [Methylomarinum sp. Ch1-1]|uniref:Uncharacterized protein n=1 Tax=Methylomarinum roseum TaxID=3067653 RepID=A0AAU7P0K6_9GAMM|nr:hypothetical protein [Methylomarinum sp. Ch1-1]MDP4518947.1 hypothetical protein [Methylomarinum sp. Ch1-1]MDP4523347.1 hypothetical protein [Methylomarinum sp. Ch1-1]
MSFFNLQQIDQDGIKNHHPFGKDLQAFCAQDKNIELFPSHGFMDGGCYALAIALKQYLSGVRTAFYSLSRPGIIDHIVLQVKTPSGEFYLDADGIATKDDLLTKAERMENFCQPELNPFDPASYDEEDLGITGYYIDGIPFELTARLRSALGEFDPDMLDVQWIDAEDDLEDQGATPG